jgi:hypothetical protein
LEINRAEQITEFIFPTFTKILCLVIGEFAKTQRKILSILADLGAKQNKILKYFFVILDRMEKSRKTSHATLYSRRGIDLAQEVKTYKSYFN